jgi:transcriptional regulator with XRE-family HTH domain
MDPTHLAKIERGQGNPTLHLLVQIATALNTPVEYLVREISAADLPDTSRPYSEEDLRRSLRADGE